MNNRVEDFYILILYHGTLRFEEPMTRLKHDNLNQTKSNSANLTFIILCFLCCYWKPATPRGQSIIDSESLAEKYVPLYISYIAIQSAANPFFGWSTGRESTLDEKVYYFYIKFTNNAKKDAEIFIPGTKKTNAIPPGKSLSLKFSKFKMEPADFVALSKPFKEPLLLNSLPIMNIKPNLDADKIVDVTITNPSKPSINVFSYVAIYIYQQGRTVLKSR